MRWMFLLSVMLIVGCTASGSKKRAAAGSADAGLPGNNVKESGLIVTPSSAVAGKVSFANLNARYVVVTYPIGELPPIGRRLNVYRAGLKVGEITISGPQRDVNTVADIVAGECQVGDDVRSE